MARKPGTLQNYRCCMCGDVKLVSGGSHNFKCAPCRASMPPSAEAAKYAVARAIRSGLLRPARELKCVDCGADAAGYDHRDYAKPLDVQPVCRSCNCRRGPAANHVPVHKPWGLRKLRAAAAAAADHQAEAA